MKPTIEPQTLADRFNEDEAVWQSYERKRELRRLLGPDSRLPQEILDYLDRLEAERECRKMRCIGFVSGEK
jgi:hypothetical protein